jgi:hypothetical protein
MVFLLKLPFMIIIIFYLENNNSNNKIYHCQDIHIHTYIHTYIYIYIYIYIYMNKKMKFFIKEIFFFSLIQFIRIFILIFICLYSINHASRKNMLL